MRARVGVFSGCAGGVRDLRLVTARPPLGDGDGPHTEDATTDEEAPVEASGGAGAGGLISRSGGLHVVAAGGGRVLGLAGFHDVLVGRVERLPDQVLVAGHARVDLLLPVTVRGVLGLLAGGGDAVEFHLLLELELLLLERDFLRFGVRFGGLCRIRLVADEGSARDDGRTERERGFTAFRETGFDGVCAAVGGGVRVFGRVGGGEFVVHDALEFRVVLVHFLFSVRAGGVRGWGHECCGLGECAVGVVVPGEERGVPTVLGEGLLHVVDGPRAGGGGDVAGVFEEGLGAADAHAAGGGEVQRLGPAVAVEDGEGLFEVRGRALRDRVLPPAPGGHLVAEAAGQEAGGAGGGVRRRGDRPGRSRPPAGGWGGGRWGRGGRARRGPAGTDPAAGWGLGGHARAPRAGGPSACRARWSWGSGSSGVRSPVSVSEGWWLRVVTGDLGVDVLVEGADVVGLQAVAGLPPGLLESVLGGGRGGRAGPAEVEVEVEGEPATVGVAGGGPRVRLRLARIRLRLALGAPWCALARQSAYVIRRRVQCALRLSGGAQWTQGAQGVGLGPVGEGLEGAHAVDAGGDGHLRAELVEGVVQAVEGRVAGTHQSIVVGPLTQVPGLTERGEGDQLVLGVAAADGLSVGAAGADAELALQSLQAVAPPAGKDPVRLDLDLLELGLETEELVEAVGEHDGADDADGRGAEVLVLEADDFDRSNGLGEDEQVG